MLKEILKSHILNPTYEWTDERGFYGNRNKTYCDTAQKNFECSEEILKDCLNQKSYKPDNALLLVDKRAHNLRQVAIDDQTKPLKIIIHDVINEALKNCKAEEIALKAFIRKFVVGSSEMTCSVVAKYMAYFQKKQNADVAIDRTIRYNVKDICSYYIGDVDGDEHWYDGSIASRYNIDVVSDSPLYSAIQACDKIRNVILEDHTELDSTAFQVKYNISNSSFSKE